MSLHINTRSKIVQHFEKSSVTILSVTLSYFSVVFREKVCLRFRDSGAILEELLIRMRRITEMVTEGLRSIQNRVRVGTVNVTRLFI